MSSNTALYDAGTLTFWKGLCKHGDAQDLVKWGVKLAIFTEAELKQIIENQAQSTQAQESRASTEAKLKADLQEANDAKARAQAEAEEALAAKSEALARLEEAVAAKELADSERKRALDEKEATLLELQAMKAETAKGLPENGAHATTLLDSIAAPPTHEAQLTAAPSGPASVLKRKDADHGGAAEPSKFARTHAATPLPVACLHHTSLSDHGQVLQLCAYSQKPAKGKDVLVALLADGTLACFAKPKTTKDDDECTFQPLIPGSPIIFPFAGGRVERACMHKLLRTEKLLVCRHGEVKLHEMTSGAAHEFSPGLRDGSASTQLEKHFIKVFGGALHDRRVHAATMHPFDNNLYAMTCADSSLIIKNFHLSKHQVIDEYTCKGVPTAHALFAPQGKVLVVCASTVDASGNTRVTLSTREVPPHVLSPGVNVAENLECLPREAYPDTEEGRKEYERERKRKAKEQMQEVQTRWKEEMERENRGDRLLPDPVNVVSLDSCGHPVAMMAKPNRLDDKRGTEREYVLLLWENTAELWLVAGGAIGKDAKTTSIPGITCAMPVCLPSLDAVSAGGNDMGSSDSAQYWLVGARDGRLHVLQSDLQHVSLALEPGGQPGTIPLAESHGGISALCLNAPVQEIGNVSWSTLILNVGCVDGAILQYHMQSLLQRMRT